MPATRCVRLPAFLTGAAALLLMHGLVCATAEAEYCESAEASADETELRESIAVDMSAVTSAEPSALQSLDPAEVDASGWISLSPRVSLPSARASYEPFEFEIASSASLTSAPVEHAEEQHHETPTRPRWCLTGEGPECESAPPIHSVDLELLVLAEASRAVTDELDRARFVGEVQSEQTLLHPRDHLAGLERPPRA